MDYNELNRALRRGADMQLDASLQTGSAGNIETRQSLLDKGKQKRENMPKGKGGSITALASKSKMA